MFYAPFILFYVHPPNERVRHTDRDSLRFSRSFLWNSTDDFKIFRLSFHLSVYCFHVRAQYKYFNLLKLLENEAYSIDTCVLERTVLLLALIRVKDIALNEFKVKLLFGKLGFVEFYDFASFLFVCLHEYATLFSDLFCCASGGGGDDGGAGDDNGFALYCQQSLKGSWRCDFFSVGWHDCCVFSLRFPFLIVRMHADDNMILLHMLLLSTSTLSPSLLFHLGIQLSV